MMHIRIMRKSSRGLARAMVVAIDGLLLAACDPMINIAGAHFPAWLLCLVLGVVIAVPMRYFFAACGLEPHLGPLPLIYPCLAVMLACVIWVAFFNRI